MSNNKCTFCKEMEAALHGSEGYSLCQTCYDKLDEKAESFLQWFMRRMLFKQNGEGEKIYGEAKGHLLTLLSNGEDHARP